MSTQLAKQNTTTLPDSVMESLVIKGDLSGLNPKEKTEFVKALCYNMGLNPGTQPFEILKLQGKERLYINKGGVEQLRKIYHISIVDIKEKTENEIYKVIITVKDKAGRTDIGTGAVAIANLKGENLANAYMKAESKAKRRATLSLVGLGLMDISELENLGDLEPSALQTESETPEIDLTELITEINIKGRDVYTENWEAKRKNLILALTKQRTEYLNKLTPAELERIIKGLDKKKKEIDLNTQIKKEIENQIQESDSNQKVKQVESKLNELPF